VGGTALPAPTSSLATFEAFFFDVAFPAVSTANFFAAFVAFAAGDNDSVEAGGFLCGVFSASSAAGFEANFFAAFVPSAADDSVEAGGFAGDEADVAAVFAFRFAACDFVGEAVFAAGVFVGEVAFAAGFPGDFFLGGIVLPRCFAKYNPLVLLDLTRAGHSLKRCGFFTYPPSGRCPS
jgi:hypothetical protein